jgi:hypothetical protein
LYDEGAYQIVATGSLASGTLIHTEDICVDYGSCFTLKVYDSFGDGICCDYGIGHFEVLDASGNNLVYNDGEFGSLAEEGFCPDGTGCGFTASVNVSNTTSTSIDDGAITINTNGGVSPFLYSINGGQSFIDSNTFINLAPGDYDVFIQGATGLCDYQETVSIEACEFTTADITSTNATSVVTTDGSIVINPSSGVGPYQYSIDGGQNFVSDNEFLDLPVGPYNVVVQDAANVCLYEMNVPIEVEALSIEGNVFIDGIKIYPNPTNSYFTIEIESSSALNNTINILVYDNLGRTIKTSLISKDGGWKTTMSLDGYVSGTYFIKCYNSNFEKHFKVVKI